MLMWETCKSRCYVYMNTWFIVQNLLLQAIGLAGTYFYISKQVLVIYANIIAKIKPCKFHNHAANTRQWTNVRPAWLTVDQHYINVGSTCSMCRDVLLQITTQKPKLQELNYKILSGMGPSN